MELSTRQSQEQLKLKLRGVCLSFPSMNSLWVNIHPQKFLCFHSWWQMGKKRGRGLNFCDAFGETRVEGITWVLYTYAYIYVCAYISISVYRYTHIFEKKKKKGQLPPGRGQECRDSGGTPAVDAPHPGTSQPCRWRLVGRAHSWEHPSGCGWECTECAAWRPTQEHLDSTADTSVERQRAIRAEHP